MNIIGKHIKLKKRNPFNGLSTEVNNCNIKNTLAL